LQQNPLQYKQQPPLLQQNSLQYEPLQQQSLQLQPVQEQPVQQTPVQQQQAQEYQPLQQQQLLQQQRPQQEQPLQQQQPPLLQQKPLQYKPLQQQPPQLQPLLQKPLQQPRVQEQPLPQQPLQQQPLEPHQRQALEERQVHLRQALQQQKALEQQPLQQQQQQQRQLQQEQEQQRQRQQQQLMGGDGNIGANSATLGNSLDQSFVAQNTPQHTPFAIEDTRNHKPAIPGQSSQMRSNLNANPEKEHYHHPNVNPEKEHFNQVRTDSLPTVRPTSSQMRAPQKRGPAATQGDRREGLPDGHLNYTTVDDRDDCTMDNGRPGVDHNRRREGAPDFQQSDNVRRHVPPTTSRDSDTVEQFDHIFSAVSDEAVCCVDRDTDVDSECSKVTETMSNLSKKDGGAKRDKKKMINGGADTPPITTTTTKTTNIKDGRTSSSVRRESVSDVNHNLNRKQVESDRSDEMEDLLHTEADGSRKTDSYDDNIDHDNDASLLNTSYRLQKQQHAQSQSQKPQSQIQAPINFAQQSGSKQNCWGVVLILGSLIVLVLAMVVTGWESDPGGDSDSPKPTLSPTRPLQDPGFQYQIAYDIITNSSISDPGVLLRGCINPLCNTTNNLNISIGQIALDRCVFESDLLGNSLKEQLYLGNPVDPVVVIQCYVINLFGLSLGMDYWKKNDGWVLADKHECSWYGIVCDTNKMVLKIQLGNNNMTGNLPNKEIFRLSHLQQLELWENDINGSISEIASCSSLTHLWLSDCGNISGTIPRGIGLLTNMESIYLQNNKLQGRIPTEIGRLTQLETFSVYSNSLEGPFPSELIRCSGLKLLYVDGNKLGGTLPKNIGALESLREFRAYNNQIGGTLPKSLFYLQNLEILYLDNNRFSGSLSSGILWENMIQFAAWNNELTGTIPDKLFDNDVQNLKSLSLQNNSFNSPIPDNICQDSIKLEKLDLSNNKYITGMLPNLQKCVSMKTLKLSNNKLNGPIPSWIENLTELGVLNLDGNNFSGELPFSLGLLPKLSYLRLHRNPEVNGTITDKLCDQVKELCADCPPVTVQCCNNNCS